MFRKPEIADLRVAATQLGITPSDQYLRELERVTSLLSTAYEILDATPEELPAVKYPRQQGYTPPADENPCNAWYVKTSIKGAESGPLAGKRIALKDNICLAGIPMMIGAQVLEGYVPDVDATLVERILDAGGEIAGKAVCEYFCLSGGSHTSSTGPVENPYKAGHSAGGSSSGSAALVAANDVDMSIGGDQAGSIRIPASHCGIVGLKPTFGLVPYTGIAGLEMTIDHVGPMTKTVRDNALLLQVIAGPDGIDSRQHGAQVKDYTAAVDRGVRNLRIGVLKEGFGHPNSEPDVDQKVRQAAACLQSMGAVVEDVSIPDHQLGFALWVAIRNDSAWINLIEINGLGLNNEGLNLTSLVEYGRRCRDGAEGFADTLKASSLFSRYSLTNYGGLYYGKAQNLRRRLRAAYDRVFERYDLLLLPTVPLKASAHPSPDASPAEIVRKSWEVTRNTLSFNVTGHPAISVPCGMSDGLPIGMMLVGRRWEEDTIYQAAAAFEGEKDWTKL